MRQPHEQSVFLGVRVLELTDQAGQLCGKLLADMGADVIKIEPPGGSPVRAVRPFRNDSADPNGSLTFWHYNTSKRAITLDLGDSDRRDLFRRLAASADVLVESLEPGCLSKLGCGYEELKAENPGLIFCSLTPFGQHGPWVGYRSTDLVHLALGGIVATTGYSTLPEAPPIAPVGGQAWHIGSYFAALAICVALFHRERTGLGQYIDVAIHDAVAVTTEMAFHFYVYNNAIVKRQTGRHAHIRPTPPTNFRTRDGRYINAMLVYLDTRKWLDLVEWLNQTEDAEDLTDDIYLIPEILEERMAHVTDVVERFIGKHDLEYLHHGAQDRKLAWSPIRAVDDLWEDPHLVEDRAFFSVVEHSELGQVYPYVGAPLKLSRSHWEIRSRAPLLGEHNAEVLDEFLSENHARHASTDSGSSVKAQHGK